MISYNAIRKNKTLLQVLAGDDEKELKEKAAAKDAEA